MLTTSSQRRDLRQTGARPLIERISIQRFKSICKAELDLGRVNMFIGSNGAGKSNVLEAIGVASASVDRGVDDQELQNKGVRITPPPLMTSSFPSMVDEEKSFVLSVRMSGDIEYEVELESVDDDRRLSIVSESCNQDDQEIFRRTKQAGELKVGPVSFSGLPPVRGIWEPIRSISSDLGGVTDALDILSKYAIYAPQVEFLRGQAVGLSPVAALGLHGEGLPAAVESLLEHRGSIHDTPEGQLQWDALQLVFLPGWANFVQVGEIDDRLVSRAVVGKGQAQSMLYFVDKYMEKRRKRLSVYDSSEGTLFLLFVAVLLVHSDSPKIFALDNVDNGLNPAMTRKMIEKIIEITDEASTKGFQCGPRQVFLTSHNPTALDAFDLFESDQRVFVVSRNSLGNTEITRLKPADGMARDDWVATHHGNSLSKLWIEGAIEGALGPDL